MELLEHIYSFCGVGELVTLLQTNKKFNFLIIHFSTRWKQLCAEDFDTELTSKGKFPTYYEIYKLLYCSRMLLGSYVYARYFDNKKPRIPNWLMHWASLSRREPMMKYGRERIKKRVRGHYLKRFNDTPFGQVCKVYSMTGYDLMSLSPARIQRNTFYFSYQAIKYAGIRKHGSLNRYMEFMLEKCHRSRGYIQRNYSKILHSDPLLPL